MARGKYSNKNKNNNAERSFVPFTKQAAEDTYFYYDLNYIFRAVKSPWKTREEGRRLAQNGTVKLTDVQTGFLQSYYGGDPAMEAYGTVNYNGMHSQVSVTLKKDKIISMRCDCPGCYNSYFNYDGTASLCAHVWALLFLTEDYIIRYNPGDGTEEAALHMLYEYRRSRLNAVRAEIAGEHRTLYIEPRLEKNLGILSASFKSGTDKLYVIKDLTRFVEQVEGGEKAEFGKSTVIDYANCSLDEQSQQYFAFIREAVNEELGRQAQLMTQRSTADMAKSLRIMGKIPLIGGRIDAFYDLVRGGQVEYTDKDTAERKTMIACRKTKPSVELTISACKDSRGDFDGITVSGNMPALIEGARGCYFVSDGYLNGADTEDMRDLLPLYRTSDIRGYFRFEVGRKNLSEFYYSLLPVFRSLGRVNEPDAEEIDRYLAPEVSFKFYLDATDENIGCRVESHYGDRTAEIMDIFDRDKRKSWESWRDISREEEAADRVLSYFPIIDSRERIFHCGREEGAIFRVLSQGVNDLMSLGEVHCTESFLRLRIRPTPKITVGVSVKSSVMDLSISSEDLSREDLLLALESYRRRKKYFRLKNGDFVTVDEPGMEALSEMLEAMHITPKEFVRGKMQVPVYRSLYLDKMLEQGSGIYAKRDSHFRQLIKEFKTVEDSDFEVPESLSQTLRSYQATGYKWIRTLASCGFGGILADDMGLGKTIQMISAFVAWKEEGIREQEEKDSVTSGTDDGGPCLVVCPATLMYNWMEEFARFAPGLSVGLIAGQPRDREEILEHYAEYDALVTSYDLIKRDIDKYETCRFLCEVLDEAQFIKNPATASAKSVKLVHSRYRFALTGTPIENRLSELWSIFDYLMPGFLYEYSVFRKEFETPIVKNKNEEASARLRRMVSPFILRRLKKDVLKDLPDKLEKVCYAKFEAPQQRLYDAQVAHMQQILLSQDEESFARDRIRVLAELTRIRQICCDPSLIYEDYAEGSAKREACLDLVHQAMDGGHQMLIFSQFTSMLALIEDDLKAEEIKYYKITGETPKKDRLEMVHAFNEDGTPVFLISLKAGGTGLNLTGADIVIHYDPWWNVAVQNQATDRAHRIGQTQIVSVYRLIAKGSIEEKILNMQEEKKDLAEEILSGESTGLGSMSREDLMGLLGV